MSDKLLRIAEETPAKPHILGAENSGVLSGDWKVGRKRAQGRLQQKVSRSDLLGTLGMADFCHMCPRRHSSMYGLMRDRLR